MAERKPLVFRQNRIIELPAGDTIVGGGSGNSFLTISHTDLEDINFYFYGGLSSVGSWQINRYDKNNLVARTSAEESNNPLYDTVSSAWAARLTLTYS